MRKTFIIIIVLLTGWSLAFGWGLGVGGVVGGGYVVQPASWDLLNEDCSSLTGWTDISSAGVSASVNPASQFKFDSGASTGVGVQVGIEKDMGSLPNTFTVELKTYHDALGAYADVDRGRFMTMQSDEAIDVLFATDGLYTRDGTGYHLTGTDLVKTGQWQTWRFCVSLTGTAGAGTMDVYLYDLTHAWTKVITGAACSYAVSVTDGTTRYYQHGQTTANRLTHMDYMKMSTGITAP